MNDNETSDELRAQGAQLKRLSELTGYQAILKDLAAQIDLIGVALQGDNELMAIGDVLRQNAADVKAANESLNQAIDAAIARLSDNATQADIDAAVADLQAAKNTATEALNKVNTQIDPDQGGGVVDDGSGGVTEGDQPQ